MKGNKYNLLVICIIMDLLGYATYTVPFLGEFADLLWAPFSAIVFMKIFGGWKGFAGGLFNFAEELLPGSDFIPSFTLMWLWKEASAKSVGVTA